MSGASWSKLIYKSVTVSDPAVDGRQKCEALCMADSGPCYLLVWDSPVCHLGDFHVDATVVDAATASLMPVYQRRGETFSVPRN